MGQQSAPIIKPLVHCALGHCTIISDSDAKDCIYGEQLLQQGSAQR